MDIRLANYRDVDAICDVLRRSIESLCLADHKANGSILNDWLKNKTPHVVGSWLDDPSLCVLVAIADSRIAGVGAVAKLGEITLNYVSPDFRFQGVSKAILASLERFLLNEGNTTATLTSTTTAHRFYLGLVTKTMVHRHHGAAIALSIQCARISFRTSKR